MTLKGTGYSGDRVPSRIITVSTSSPPFRGFVYLELVQSALLCLENAVFCQSPTTSGSFCLPTSSSAEIPKSSGDHLEEKKKKILNRIIVDQVCLYKDVLAAASKAHLKSDAKGPQVGDK